MMDEESEAMEDDEEAEAMEEEEEDEEAVAQQDDNGLDETVVASMVDKAVKAALASHATGKNRLGTKAIRKAKSSPAKAATMSAKAEVKSKAKAIVEESGGKVALHEACQTVLRKHPKLRERMVAESN